MPNFIALLVISGFLVACGEQPNTADSQPSAEELALDRFLIFPNPQVQDDGSLQVAEAVYANAYYAAIDPSNLRATADGFRSVNQFGSGTGTEHLVVFRDTHDLGSGRRMIGRKNTNGTLAFIVENYRVDAGTGLYTSINVEAAVAQDHQWMIGINGIEFSPISGAPSANCGNCVVKFYNFDPVTRMRQTMVDLDTRGPKAMPTICITCHGGRGDPLKADGAFPRSVTSNTQVGNTQARLQPFDVASFDYSSRSGYTRADQESKLRDFNLWVLCSYPVFTGFDADTGVNACRPSATANEWWSRNASDMIKAWYGDVANGTAALGNTFVGNYIPTDWVTAGRSNLWNNVVAKYCRTCHIVRGSVNQNHIDFTNDIFGGGWKFETFKERIKAHVFDRGNMPLSLYVFQNFWNDSTAVDTLADFLEESTPSGAFPVRVNGAIPDIGRPIAEPGPSRNINSGGTLSAAGSVFATSYQWSVVSCSSTALTFANANAVTTTITWAAANGQTCTVRLTVASTNGLTHAKDLVLTRDTNMPAAPSFANVKAFLQASSATCLGCHSNDIDSNGVVDVDPDIAFAPPIFYNSYDRNGDSLTNATDDTWFYRELRGRVNLTDPLASPLLRKPLGFQHGGGSIFNFSSATACAACAPYATFGAYYRGMYGTLAGWIARGAPQN